MDTDFYYENGKTYIYVPDIYEYACERFGTRFGIPSTRTLRFYKTRGMLTKPFKKGRKTYYELSYILYFIRDLRKEK